MLIHVWCILAIKFIWLRRHSSSPDCLGSEIHVNLRAIIPQEAAVRDIMYLSLVGACRGIHSCLTRFILLRELFEVFQVFPAWLNWWEWRVVWEREQWRVRERKREGKREGGRVAQSVSLQVLLFVCVSWNWTPVGTCMFRYCMCA